MRRSAIIAIACLSAGIWVEAHTFYTTKITWSRDVSRIFYRSCVSCHRPGGPSFSLVTYREARPWAEAIKLEVLERRMPPWNAVKGFGEFKDDRGLTQEDLEIVGEWVEGGAPEGNPLYMPPPPDFSAGSHENHGYERRLSVSGDAVIKHPVEVMGIEPGPVPASGEIQVVAHRPDAAVEPLIWLENFNPAYKQTYYFREPLRFSAGTRIEVLPRQGTVTLMIK